MLTGFANGYSISLNLTIWVCEEMMQYLIKARFIDPDYRMRMDLEELLAALKSSR